MRQFIYARKAATAIQSAARGRQARLSYLRGCDRSFFISEISRLRAEQRRLVDELEQKRAQSEQQLEAHEQEIGRHQQISSHIRQEQALALKSLAACLTPGTIVQVHNEQVRFPSPPFVDKDKERRWNLGPIDVQGVQLSRGSGSTG